MFHVKHKIISNWLVNINPNSPTGIKKMKDKIKTAVEIMNGLNIHGFRLFGYTHLILNGIEILSVKTVDLITIIMATLIILFFVI